MGTLSELPRELLVGWALWVVGGVLLVVWFWRRSATTRGRDPAPPLPHGGVAKLSGTHPAAGRGLSGTHATASRSAPGTRPAAPRASSTVNPPDAFAELRALLDRPEDPPRAG